jgi:hypothetical protein
MLSTPFQNADMLHRSEIVSELRSAQTQRNAAEQQSHLAVTKRQEERKEAEVEATPRTELDPDAHQQEESYQGRKKKRKQSPKDASQGTTPKNLGAGHIDLIA